MTSTALTNKKAAEQKRNNEAKYIYDQLEKENKEIVLDEKNGNLYWKHENK